MEINQDFDNSYNYQALHKAWKVIGTPLKRVGTITSIDPALSKVSDTDLIAIFNKSSDRVGESLDLVSYQSKDSCQEVQDWIPDVLCILGGLKTIYNEGKSFIICVT
jgi:hypothetical protein